MITITAVCDLPGVGGSHLARQARQPSPQGAGPGHQDLLSLGGDLPPGPLHEAHPAAQLRLPLAGRQLQTGGE